MAHVLPCMRVRFVLNHRMPGSVVDRCMRTGSVMAEPHVTMQTGEGRRSQADAERQNQGQCLFNFHPVGKAAPRSAIRNHDVCSQGKTLQDVD